MCRLLSGPWMNSDRSFERRPLNEFWPVPWTVVHEWFLIGPLNDGPWTNSGRFLERRPFWTFLDGGLWTNRSVSPLFWPLEWRPCLFVFWTAVHDRILIGPSNEFWPASLMAVFLIESLYMSNSVFFKTYNFLHIEIKIFSSVLSVSLSVFPYFFSTLTLVPRRVIAIRILQELPILMTVISSLKLIFLSWPGPRSKPKLPEKI